MGGRRIFRRLSSVDEVQRELWRRVGSIARRVEVVPLEASLGRVLAEDIHSNVDVPGFDRATKDGFAVRAEDTYGADQERPVRLSVVGTSSAGNPFVGEVGSGEAVEIATGAPVPRGADAVVMVEHTRRVNDAVKVYRAVAPGENIQPAGRDVNLGETLAYCGDIVTPREVGLLAAAGVEKVPVYSKPVVAVISTGDELVAQGLPLEYGQIYDINGPALCAAIREDGGNPVYLGIARDDEGEILELAGRGLELADILVLSGSTSAGAGDVMYRVLDKLGEPGVFVHGVAMHPGKPTVVAQIGDKLAFGLPGNPTSALTAYRIFVSPVVRHLAGLDPHPPSTVVRARLAERMRAERGRRDFLPVHLVRDSAGRILAFRVPGGSEAVSTFARADGIVEVPEEVEYLEEGEEVTVTLLDPERRPADLSIIGSHCLGLEELIRLTRKRLPGRRIKSVNVGSTGGFVAIRRGEADVAGVHALDPASGEYNVPLMRKMGVADSAVLIRGYLRVQGLMVPPGNPKRINGVEDLLRGDVRMINRNPGSGTRILMDWLTESLAREMGVDPEALRREIRGYHSAAKSHAAVAAAVKAGLADVGPGIETAARLRGLDFIPLWEEHYDFLVRVDRLEKDAIQSFLEALKSNEFRKVLERLPGLKPAPNMGEVVYGYPSRQ